MYMIDLLGDYIPYFRDLNNTQLKLIEKITKRYECKSGDVILLQGEFCQSWVIAEKGSFLSKRVDKDDKRHEKIILAGESFDFKSIISTSISQNTFEAIEDSSILVIDILGLKKIAQKSPMLISLIKFKFDIKDVDIWRENILYRKKGTTNFTLTLLSSPLWSVIKVLPFNVFIGFFLFFFFDYYKLALFIMFLDTVIFYFYSRLSYIEINRDFVVKRDFYIFKISSENYTVPLEKIEGSCIVYINFLYKLLKLGQIKIDSPSGSLVIPGVFKPERVLGGIKEFSQKKKSIDKAIEISSFKYLFSKKNGLFCLESQLECGDNLVFKFKKSIMSFLVKVLPPLIIFFISSMSLYILLRSYYVFLINIPSLFLFIWYFWDWINDEYAFIGDRVIDIEKKPFWGREKRVEADIKSIQSVKKIQKNFIHIFLNYGDIELTTLGDKIIYPSINNPDKVIDNLYLVKKYNYAKQESRNKIQRQEEFLDYTKYYQELVRK